MEPGQRDKRIRFERQVPTLDDHGGMSPGWTHVGKAWARVRYGSGEERRQAAQRQAMQTATFSVPYTRRWAALTTEYRIIFEGAEWEISSAIPVGSNEDIEITATRTT